MKLLNPAAACPIAAEHGTTAPVSPRGSFPSGNLTEHPAGTCASTRPPSPTTSRASPSPAPCPAAVVVALLTWLAATLAVSAAAGPSLSSFPSDCRKRVTSSQLLNSAFAPTCAPSVRADALLSPAALSAATSGASGATCERLNARNTVASSTGSPEDRASSENDPRSSGATETRSRSNAHSVFATACGLNAPAVSCPRRASADTSPP